MYYVRFFIRPCSVAQYLIWASCDRKNWKLGHSNNFIAAAKFESQDEAYSEARQYFKEWDNAEFQVLPC